MVVIEFNYHNRIVKLDVEVCESIFSQGSGLMFKKKSKPLFFIFKSKKNRTIHSFFCKPFYVIWFDDDKIVEEKLVEDWKFVIKPQSKFNKFLEIPTENEFFRFVVEGKKHLNTN